MTTLSAPPVSTTPNAAMLQSFNPSTGELVGELPITSVAEIDSIVAKSRDAQAGWANLSFEQRKAAILPAGQAMLSRLPELAGILTREMGKPLANAEGEIKHCAESLERTLDGIAEALRPDVLEDDNTQSHVYHDPFGVCAAITPWNFPLAMPHWTVIPALMAGNTVVLKPSEETPVIAQVYVDILNESLPEHIVQIVHGADEQGKALVGADVNLIAFTGSREAGKHILASAAGGLKRVILELGGKDPMIVLDDADLDVAAQFAARNSFGNAGQVCVSTERIYVSDSIADAFESKVAELARQKKVGDGQAEGIEIGPMISSRQRDHVLKQVDAAVNDGATIIAGGTGHHDNFVMPTVLANVNHNMDIMRDETFGPVACISRVRDDDEAVRLANDTKFGLGAVVFGGNLDRAGSVARKLTAGMIGINKSCGGASGSPWVGANESGYGFHGGREGHRQFTQPRVVSMPKG